MTYKDEDAGLMSVGESWPVSSVWIRTAQMASSCMSNTVFCVRNRSPYNLFGWNLGRRKNDYAPQNNYHDLDDLPFPSSLVEKTFLKGTPLTLYVYLIIVHISNFWTNQVKFF